MGATPNSCVVSVQVVDDFPVIRRQVRDPFLVLRQEAGQILVPQGGIGQKAVLVHFDLGSRGSRSCA